MLSQPKPAPAVLEDDEDKQTRKALWWEIGDNLISPQKALHLNPQTHLPLEAGLLQFSGYFLRKNDCVDIMQNIAEVAPRSHLG